MFDLKIKDIHCHIMEPYSLVPEQDFLMPGVENASNILHIQERCGFDSLCIPAIALYEEKDLVCNPLALWAKQLAWQAGRRVFALAGIRRYPEEERNSDMVIQARELLECGFDGFKMICKPNARRVLSFGIDAPVFEPFYKEAEQGRWPILFHVGDPASFWDRNKIPEWALENGWYYGEDERIPSYERLYEEVEAVMERHPQLNITFAHFFFLSHDLKKAAAWLERYPNMKLDVTPGSEMYADFSEKPEETKIFFERYGGRILFGTDTVSEPEGQAAKAIADAREKVHSMRMFFETREDISLCGMPVRGIGLSEETCRKLYADSFDNFLGKEKPSEVDIEKALQLTERYHKSLKKEKSGAIENLLSQLEIKWKGVMK